MEDTVRRKRALLTNDDGLASPGLAAMLEALSAGFDVTVVAPEEQRSGAGHAVTLHRPVSAREIRLRGAPGFVVDGTPADCVKLALTHLLAECLPDVVVSGINGGPNVGRNVLYSGTVAAAIEAAANGVPAVAVSLDIGEHQDFPAAAEIALPIVAATVRRGLPPRTALNVNIPAIPRSKIPGVRLVKQGTAGFREYYVEEPSENGRRKFSIRGTMELDGDGPDDDSVALARGYVTVSVLGLRLSDGEALEAIRAWPELR
ncbi:MAG: 5'/3'-nucleotidase SurE [Planctomycetota bacterium]|nr:5'/3'-nucleotidase SurE [Planctomycetota bacterium]